MIAPSLHPETVRAACRSHGRMAFGLTTRTIFLLAAGLLLALPGGKLWAVEIKRSSAPKLERGFHLACDDLKPDKRFVVYPGNDRFPLDAHAEVIGLSALGQMLQAGN